MDARFGRAQGFFVVNTDTEETSYIDNQTNVDTGHGAGTSAAPSVADAGVELVIASEVGPKAGHVLKAAGIRVMGGIENASIEEAYDMYKKGSLQEQNL